MINQYHSRRGYQLRCEYYKAKAGPSSELERAGKPDGVFYARMESGRYSTIATPLNAFNYRTDSVSIRTPDDPGVSPNDRVRFRGQDWVVDDVQAKHGPEEQYMSDPEYILIRLRKGR